MTHPVTLTLVTGSERAGKLLVARGVSRQVNYEGESKAFVVTEDMSQSFLNYAEEFRAVRPMDFILASRSEDREPWMTPWFERYSEPLITIHVNRRET
jgi:hypothetical protein